MLEFHKDGKKVECQAIYNRGRIGQSVILDHVYFGGNPSFKVCPLAAYPQPYVFTIVKIIEGQSEMMLKGRYVLKDDTGAEIQIRGGDAAYLFDVNEWLAWNKAYTDERVAKRDRDISRLESHLDLLQSILEKQGF